jgi:hypothetical protein
MEKFREIRSAQHIARVLRWGAAGEPRLWDVYRIRLDVKQGAGAGSTKPVGHAVTKSATRTVLTNSFAAVAAEAPVQLIVRFAGGANHWTLPSPGVAGPTLARRIRATAAILSGVNGLRTK